MLQPSWSANGWRDQLIADFLAVCLVTTCHGCTNTVIITTTTKITDLVINVVSSLLRYSILARDILVVVNILYVVDILFIFSWPILNSSGFRLSSWIVCLHSHIVPRFLLNLSNGTVVEKLLLITISVIKICWTTANQNIFGSSQFS